MMELNCEGIDIKGTYYSRKKLFGYNFKRGEKIISLIGVAYL